MNADTRRYQPRQWCCEHVRHGLTYLRPDFQRTNAYAMQRGETIARSVRRFHNYSWPLLSRIEQAANHACKNCPKKRMVKADEPWRAATAVWRLLYFVCNPSTFLIERSIMTNAFIETVRSAISLAERLKTAEVVATLNKALLDGQEIIGANSNLKQENQELRDQVREFTAKLKFAETLEFIHGLYHLPDADGRIGEPFCPNCWDTSRTAVHIHWRQPTRNYNLRKLLITTFITPNATAFSLAGTSTKTMQRPTRNGTQTTNCQKADAAVGAVAARRRRKMKNLTKPSVKKGTQLFVAVLGRKASEKSCVPFLLPSYGITEDHSSYTKWK